MRRQTGRHAHDHHANYGHSRRLRLAPGRQRRVGRYLALRLREAIDEVQGRLRPEVQGRDRGQHRATRCSSSPSAPSAESADIMEQAQAGILQFVNQSPGFTGALDPRGAGVLSSPTCCRRTRTRSSSSSAPPRRSTACSPSSTPSRASSCSPCTPRARSA